VRRSSRSLQGFGVSLPVAWLQPTLASFLYLIIDEDMPLVTQVSHNEGRITRSRAKLLQKEVNSLLAEINFDMFENVILPKRSTLVVLRNTNKEEDVTLHWTSTQKM